MKAPDLRTGKQSEQADRPLRRPRRGLPAGWGYEVLLALLAAIAAAVALAPQVFVFFNLPIWVRIVLLALTIMLALAVPVVRLRSTQLEKERSWARQVRGLLKEPPGTNGQLLRLSAFSPYRLGVSPSRYGSEERRGDDPYVSRVIDETLDQALRSKCFILVVGDSKAGKSRTAYEAATRLRHAGRLHDPRVLVPKSTDLLEQLLDLNPPLDLRPEPALLWLDDLTENGLAVLTPALLHHLTGQMIVLGTLTAQRHNRVMDSESDIARTAQQALRRATVIRLETGLTNEERAEAGQKYPKERFKAGIGEQLVAVDQLTSRYDDARQGAHPHGWAVVQAAIDWTRMDVGRPISQHELVALCPLYLNQLGAHARHDDKDHEEALFWACQPVASHIALLEELASDLDEPSYVPFDYLVAAADGQNGRFPQPILDLTWDKVFALVSPWEAFRTVISAYLRQLPLRAQKILTAIARSYPSMASPGLCLEPLPSAQYDSEGAMAAYQRAIDSGHPYLAPWALNSLGKLLWMLDDRAGAKAAYEKAIDSGHPDLAPEALNSLGGLLWELDDLAGAEAAYEKAIDSGHTEVVPIALFNLGQLLSAQGDVQGAKAVYQQAIVSSYRGREPMAAFRLAKLLEEQGDLEGATAAYQQATHGGFFDQPSEAAFKLAVLLEKQGDFEGAKAAYRQVIDSDDPGWVPKAAFKLAVLLEKQGDLEGAKAASMQTTDSVNLDQTPLAAVGFEWLEKQGDLGEVKAAYQRAIASGHADQAPKAAVGLGVLLREQLDFEGAKAAYHWAIDSGHADWASLAAFNLGKLLWELGDFDGVKVAYRLAIDSGHADWASRAAVHLEWMAKYPPL